MEKIVIKTKSKLEKDLLANFTNYADPDLKEKLPNRLFITRILIQYWKTGRDRKKRVAFTRKFWENPDSNDSEQTTAFKKRNDHNKMQLRQVQKTLRQKLQRKTEVRNDTLENIIRDLIPDVWKRESTKQSLDKIHDMQFDLKYEALMKEKNQAVTQELIKLPLQQIQPKVFEEHNTIMIDVPKRQSEMKAMFIHNSSSNPALERKRKKEEKFAAIQRKQ